jgi:hypothetical protein
MLINCIFSGNQAGLDRTDLLGGGIQNSESSLTIINCTFTGNSLRAFGYGKFFPVNALACEGSDVYITNSILWNGGNEISTDNDSSITITYSNVQGGWSGEGNIDTDPDFAWPGYWDECGTPDDERDDFWIEGDYHLKSQVGRWDLFSESWIFDNVTSPCIDAGDPMSPIGLEPFPNGGFVNMGAYGGTPKASKSCFGD